MNFARKHLVLAILILVILLSLLFILGETAVREVARYASPAETQIASVSGAGSGLISHHTFDDGGAAGKIGQAKMFSSGEDRVSTSIQLPSSGGFAVSYWIKGKPSGLAASVFAQDAGGGEIALSYNSTSNAFSYENSYQTTDDITGWGYSLDDNWHHIVLVEPYSGGSTANAHLYIDGSLISASFAGTGQSIPVGNVTIGARPNGTNPYTGSLDDFRIYSRTLGASEVQELYALGTGTVSPPLAEEVEDEPAPGPVIPPPPIQTGGNVTPISPNTTPGQAYEWGIANLTRAAALSSLTDAVEISGNSSWSLARRSNGSLVAWGSNNEGQLSVPSGTFVSSNAGWQHGVACRTNGTVEEWGNPYGKTEQQWEALRPAITNCVQVVAGDDHSAALLADGRVLTWGGRGSVISKSGTIVDAVQIASGWYHVVVLHRNGTVSVFGEAGQQGQYLAPPAGLTQVVKVGASLFGSYAIKSDGTLVAWGTSNSRGELTIPSNATNIVAVSGGIYHTIALRADGTVLTWGDNSQGQLNIPTGLNSVVAIGSGRWFSQAIRSGGGVLPPPSGGEVIPPPNPPVTPPPTPPISGTHKVERLNSAQSVLAIYGGTGAIQACADEVVAGQTCLVYPGKYVRTDTDTKRMAKSGTAGSPIIFKGLPGAESNGFYVRAGSYIKIEGFTFTGDVTSIGQWMVEVAGDRGIYPRNVEVVNNIFTGNPLAGNDRGGLRTQGMILLGGSFSSARNNIIEKWDSLTGEATAIAVGGPGVGSPFSDIRVESNIIRNNADINAFRVFGHDHLFKDNIVRDIIDGPSGTHMDFVQSFGHNGEESYNITFEGNSVSNIGIMAIGQVEQGCGPDSSGDATQGNKCSSRPEVNGVVTDIQGATIVDSSKDLIMGVWGSHYWAGKLLTIVSGTARGKVYLIAENTDSTLTVKNINGSSVSLSSDGVRTGDKYELRMRLGWWTFKKNIFHSGGAFSASMPYLTFENNTFVNTESPFLGGSIYRGRSVHGRMVNNVYIGSSILYSTHQSSVYAAGDTVVKDSFYGNYNFVSGPASAYTALDARCSEEYQQSRFCEAEQIWNGITKRGINGGDPKLRDINNPSGGGLVPLIGSPLCGAGLGGVDIGAYSCGGSGQVVPPPPPSVSCSDAHIICVDDSAGSTQEARGASGDMYNTISKCALDVRAGQTCLVHTGNYREYVQVTVVGAVGNPVSFKAQGIATVEGFRIRSPYVTIDGFDITGYAIGLSPAHITVEPSGSSCIIKNNTIRDGVQLLSNQYRFNATSRTITNSAGGFLAAGFRPGMVFYIGTNINAEIQNGNVIRTVKTVTDTTITIDDAQTLITEGPVLALLYATRGTTNSGGKGGVSGITFPASSAGYASQCLISDNKISNLGGAAIALFGSHHIVEKNRIERMNGWPLFDLTGHDNKIRYNYLRNSPRYAGFEPPDGSGPDQTTGVHWDFVAQTIRSFGSPSIKGNDNVVEFNFIENLDNQLFNVTEKSATSVVNGQLVYGGAETKRFTFRNNVIYGLEFHGALHRPNSVIENNTFYKSAPESAAIINISNGYQPRDVGSAEGSIVRNNAFVEVGPAQDSSGTRGWYNIENVSSYVANHNFVSGPASLGYPAKTGFTGKETNGINGCTPALFGSCTTIFQNINNPVGPDGQIFTADDGLRPKAGSPLCTKGSSGTYIGAYSCGGGNAPIPEVVTPLPPVDTTSPALTTISASSITRNSATISWTTNEPSTTQIQYGLTTTYGSITPPIPTLTTLHTQTLTNLTASTTYNYRVISKDAAGNIATSLNGIFSTLPTPPTTNPLNPNLPVVTRPVINLPPPNVVPKEVVRPVTPVSSPITPIIPTIPASAPNFIQRFIPSFTSTTKNPTTPSTVTKPRTTGPFVPLPELTPEETVTTTKLSLTEQVRSIFSYILQRIQNGFLKIFGN